MGASNSRMGEDKALELCRWRKKLIKQALNGRCSLAAAHLNYIEELQMVGSALRRFIESEAQVEGFEYPSTSANALIEHSIAQSSFSSHPMRFRGTPSRIIEEKPPLPLVVSSFEARSDAPPWDYFGLLHAMNDHVPTQEQGILDLEDVEEKLSSPKMEKSEESEDEFDEPPSASLVRSFENRVSSLGNVNEAEGDVVNDDSHIGPSESVISETINALDLNDDKDKEIGESEVEDKVGAKDFFSSVNDVEQLFVKASESGKEVPRMLEANMFHSCQIFHGNERGSIISSSLLRLCFTCGKDTSEVQQEVLQNSVKYFTWHRATSSRNLVIMNSAEDKNDPKNNLFDNFCMVSGSHASTLDRLYAWEKKLFDEVKVNQRLRASVVISNLVTTLLLQAGQVLKSNFDGKCKLLRLKESGGKNVDKNRAAVKILHSRISVAVHRINSVSKTIEEIRDRELQPQLEELIEGLRRMWELMVEFHKLQFHIISISHIPASTNTKVQSDSQRQIIIHLGYELSSLSSSFTKWISAQKVYVEAIDKWLCKCFWLPQIPSKRNKRMRPRLLRNRGPPIYMICGAWLQMIDELPCKGVSDSIKELASEVARFLPRQDKSKGTAATKHDLNSTLGDEVIEDRMPRLRISLAGFLGQLNSFAESSLKMFTQLQKSIQDAKTNDEQYMSQRAQV